MKLPVIGATGTLIAIALYALWPSTAHINPSLPQPGLISVPERNRSSILVPIEVSFSDLGALIEKHFPDGMLLHSGSKQESPSFSYKYKVRRSGPSSFQVKDGAIELSLPLRIDATGRKDICLGIKISGKCKGIKTHESGESTAMVDAVALIAFSVDEDYNIEVGSNVTQSLSNRPHLSMDIFGDAIHIKINIEGEVEKLLARQEGKVTSALDRLLARELAKLSLRPTLEKYWREANSPIKAGNAWISLAPEQILFKGIHELNEDRVALGFGFSGQTSVSLSKPAPRKPRPLPPVTAAFTLEKAPDDFRLSVPLTSAFAELNQTAKKLLVGRTLKQDDHWLLVEDLEITGAALKNNQGEDRATLIAAVSFNAGKGDVEEANIVADGTLHLTFMPSVNREKRTLEIVDVAATSDTLSLLDAAGVGWLNSKFTPQLMAKLSYDYGAEIDHWKPILNNALNDGIAYKGFTIRGVLQEFDIGGFYVSGADLEVYLNARGTVAVTLDKLPL